MPLSNSLGSYGMLGNEPGSAVYKANALPTTLLLRPLKNSSEGNKEVPGQPLALRS